MQVSISRALHAELLALAAAEPTREVCGLLFGTAERIEDIEPCINVSMQSETSFEIDPSALIAAHKRERAGGVKIIGCYHSHPNGVGEMSPLDLAAAENGQIWGIMALGEIHWWSCSHMHSQRIAQRLEQHISG